MTNNREDQLKAIEDCLLDFHSEEKGEVTDYTIIYPEEWNLEFASDHFKSKSRYALGGNPFHVFARFSEVSDVAGPLYLPFWLEEDISDELLKKWLDYQIKQYDIPDYAK